jgi:hypothetical protein
MPSFVVDSIPSSLIRAFSEDWHRATFLKGSVRMKHIRQFQKSADVRTPPKDTRMSETP